MLGDILVMWLLSLMLFLAFLLSPSLLLSKSDTRLCFRCHTEFQEADYKGGAHGSFDCLFCHKDFNMSSHLVHLKKKDEKWRRALNETCFTCHDQKVLSQKSHHKSTIGSDIPCSKCHDPHLSVSIREEKRVREERDYCLSCHGKDLYMRLRDGTKMSLYVDRERYLRGVHGKNKCSFCHTEFSKEKHPRRVFENRKDFVTRLSPNACARCHADECKRYEGCVHGAVAREKKELAPVCSDCHNPHYGKKVKEEPGIQLDRCVSCHRNVFEAYKESAHYRAFRRGDMRAPLCTSCHRPHEVIVTSFDLRNNDTCLTCHKGVEKVHANWFYNPPIRSESFMRFHLQSIACNVCHSSEKNCAIYLNPLEKRSRESISLEVMRELFGVDREKLGTFLDANRNGEIDVPELWNLFGSLSEKGYILTLLGWMDVKDPISSHRTQPKERALRDCEACHRPDSPFFKTTFLVFRDKYGWPYVFKASREVLGLRSRLSPLSEFYVFGSTRLWIVDFLLILAVIGAILVPATHITMRILTRKFRKKGRSHG